MSASSLLTRYSGPDGSRLLVTLLKTQSLVGGNDTIAQELLSLIVLRELSVSELLITQGDADNDVYFILSGGFRVLVNNREVATRGPGQHVGEMVAINPAMTRTATVIAVEPSVVASISEANFSASIRKHPEMLWPICLELSRRLDQRKQFHKEPNKTPIIFIGSSKESLPIASALATSIPVSAAHVTLWSEGVFGASHFPIEDLEAQVKIADLAILVCSGDDHVISRGADMDAPRDNVVFELGLFMGALTRYRTYLLVPNGKPIKLPTDLLGINSIRYSTSAATGAEAVADAAKEIIELVSKLGPK